MYQCSFSDTMHRNERSVLFAEIRDTYSKASSPAYFGSHKDRSSQTFDNRLADTQSKTGSLCKVVHLIESFEDMTDTFFGNADSRIFHKDSGIFGIFIFLISESNGTVSRKLGSIIDQIIDDLLDGYYLSPGIFSHYRAYEATVPLSEAYSVVENHALSSAAEANYDWQT